MDLSIRSKLPEELDGPETDPSDYRQCRTELAVINRITLTHRPTLRWLAKATRGMTDFSLLDVGYGDGDLLRAIARWADKRGMRAFLWGIDLNPRSAETAREATPSWMDIRYHTGDVFDPINDLCPPVDFVVSSQFTHHLTDDGVVEFLRWAEANSVRGWHTADLHRSAVAFYGFQLVGAAMGWHRITVNDGVISIARGLPPPGMADLPGQGRFARGHRLAHGIPILREPHKAGRISRLEMMPITSARSSTSPLATATTPPNRPGH